MRRFVGMAAVVMLLVSLIAAPAAFAAGQAGAQLSGKVVDTMNSGGYTYVQIEKDGVKTWVAVRQIAGVKKGQTMSFQPGALMTNFHSNTLNRTFDKIYFSTGVAK